MIQLSLIGTQRLTPLTGLVIAGTGHRPDKLGGYSAAAEAKVMEVARNAIDELRPARIISGMALGWDTALAKVAIEVGIPLIAAVPFNGFHKKWVPESQRAFQAILNKASEVVIVDELRDGTYQELNGNIAPGIYNVAKLQTRNIWMVDNCEMIAALWDGSSGGTANCLKYARGMKRVYLNYWENFDAL